MEKIKLPNLYAVTKTGQTRSFKIHCYQLKQGALMVTKKRLEPNGKITYDKYFYTKGKNLGRSNETTAWEQCQLEAQSLFNRLKDKRYHEKDEELDQYPEPMLAIKWDESKIKFPCMVQPKLDGVRCIVYVDKHNQVKLMSRRGKEINLPHLKQYLEKHKDWLPLDGELYNHKDLTFQQIISAVKRLSDISEKITLTVYDKPVPNKTNQQRQQELNNLSSLIKKNEPVSILPSILCNTLDDIYTAHRQFTDQGYEGAIIRNLDALYQQGYRSNNLIKLKSFQDEEFKIIDIQEAKGRDKGTALFVLIANNGEPFNARPQGSKELRAQYLKDKDILIGKLCTVRYQELSDKGIPRFPSAIAIRDYEEL